MTWYNSAECRATLPLRTLRVPVLNCRVMEPVISSGAFVWR
ncbi:hypothetical protein [Mesorhizobium ciceri]